MGPLVDGRDDASSRRHSFNRSFSYLLNASAIPSGAFTIVISPINDGRRPGPRMKGGALDLNHEVGGGDTPGQLTTLACADPQSSAQSLRLKLMDSKRNNLLSIATRSEEKCDLPTLCVPGNCAYA